MTKNNKPRILLYDIETLMNKGYFFGLFDQGINHNFIVKDKSIITIAYKWYGEKGGVKGLSIADFPKEFKNNPHDDKKLLEEFSKIINQADYIVGHYSDKFDNKFIQSRVLINKLKPIKLPVQIDTYKMLKKHFNLNSNRLDYVGKLLGFGGKMSMNWSYWRKIAEGDLAAAKKMMLYNKQDVVLLEKIFKSLLPYCESKLNFNLFTTDGKLVCRKCGSKDLWDNGYTYTTLSKIKRHRCKICDGITLGERIQTK